MTNKFLKYYFWFLPFAFFIIGYFSIGFLYRHNEFQIPCIVGKNIHQATSILSSQNLNVRIIKDKEDSALEPGTVLSQEPRCSSRIKPNQTVFVTVSKAPALIPAPDILGKDYKDTLKHLKRQNIRNKTYAFESDQPKDTCVGQIPEKNELLPEKKIIIYKSKGTAKPAIFPDFRGKNIQNIIEIFKEHGIDPEILHNYSISEEHSCQHCKVTHQRPLPGTLVQLESGINVQLQVE
ncbi:PASTA domain-containing protein [bacterium]|mgnify:CR=1 FL=1|jgi:beta-lactam-binding protein with PASTA domain|nr:PASTA domain-containing protein [bacterium]